MKLVATVVTELDDIVGAEDGETLDTVLAVALGDDVDTELGVTV